MKEKGYSILEVLLAFAIFSIALLPLLSSYGAIFRMQRIAGEREESSRLAINVADYIRAKGYDKLTKATTNGAVDFDLPFTATFEYDSGVWKKDGTGNSFEDYFNLGNDGEWFIINSKALRFEGANKATITVKLDKVPVELSENYVDPITGTTDTNGYIYKGRDKSSPQIDYSENVNEFLIGRITVDYKNAKGDSRTFDKYQFVMSPLEKWK